MRAMTDDPNARFDRLLEAMVAGKRPSPKDHLSTEITEDGNGSKREKRPDRTFNGN